MDTPEFKDMDMELTKSPKEDDLSIEKVPTAPSSEMQNENPELPGERQLTDSVTPGQDNVKKVNKGKKLKKSERRLNKKYETLKAKLARWTVRYKEASELLIKREALVKDIEGLIKRSVEMKESGKNIALLKKAMKRIKSGKKDKKTTRNIRNKINKIEKKLGRVDTKLA